MSGSQMDPNSLAVETRRSWMREAGFDELEISESISLKPPTSVREEEAELRAVRRLNSRGVTPPKKSRTFHKER